MLGRAGAWATAIQNAVATAEGGKYVRTTRFVSISSGSSGTVSLPLNSQVVLDDFGGTVDAVVLQISGGKPTKLPALTATGSVVATTFDASGNWAFTGVPVSFPVAIVYRVQTQLAAFDSTSSDIWGESEMFGAQLGAISFTIDGGGGVIGTGFQDSIVVPFDCTIQSAAMFADQSGSVVVDIWKCNYSTFPPVIAGTITASDLPTLSSAQKMQDTTLTGWTLSLSAGDMLGFNVNSATTIQKLLVVLGVARR